MTHTRSMAAHTDDTGGEEASQPRAGTHSAGHAGGSRRAATTERHDDEPSLAQLLANQNRLFERMVANSENIGAAMAQQANQAPSKLQMIGFVILKSS
ncbi:hypothetical protein OsJ_17902 [Oryza sativa Japonica Group]|uniref:Uncharacterized protein n=1 Tax=Oryza sativa subsp. japonica TaxID=39947 RepID=B9FJW1_ORYSJ|nr:hypothetical protein OsJ_17902 [Oryza sativa Japonica Group]